MKNLSRRSVLSAFGVALPFGLGDPLKASATPVAPTLSLRLIPFEDAVREAFTGGSLPRVSASNRQRIEVGHSDLVQEGVQGCHNDRPFAGFPTGHLRIIRTGSGPGPIRHGVRFYVSTVAVVLTGGLTRDAPSRPLDFASLPAAPNFS